MMYAERRSDCEAAKTRFAGEYQAKYPKAVESLTANWERLVSFFDFSAEHGKQLRTANVIESAFATVRLRERARTAACGSSGRKSPPLFAAIQLRAPPGLRCRRRVPVPGHRRTGREAAVIVTTNLPFSEWTQVIPNARLCKALLDRITDRANIIETGAESYRFRRTLEKRKGKTAETNT
jgi:hypothetical protein